MRRDLTLAFRSLRKSPVFSLTAILTIALGIGASTAIFSVTNAVLLRPLPYRDPDKLVFAISELKKRNVKDFPFSNAGFLDLKNGTTSQFEEMAALNAGRGTAPQQDGTPEQIRFASVTPNFFRMMGARIDFGRDFNEADGQAAATPATAVAGAAAPPTQRVMAILSYSYWQRRFGGDRSIIGKTLPGPNNTEIVGVLAPGFELMFPPELNIDRNPDIWFALRLAYDNANRNQVSLRLIGRLKPGATIEQAQSAADLIAAEARRNFTIQATSGYAIRLEPMHRHLVQEVRPALLALMGAVIFLLLIACSNVANLMLVRASLKERELAVRTALGGSSWRLIRQMFVEALLLSTAGAVVGLALAWAGIRELRAIAPAGLPRLDSIAIDPAVLAFAVIAACVAAALFGIVPAVRAARPDVAQVLRASGRTAGLGRSGLLRNAVVVVEVALSFILLIGSGLMFRSFLALEQIDTGYNAHNLLTFQLIGGRNGRTPEERAANQRNIQTRLSELPGVQSVTAARPFPLNGLSFPIRWGTAEAANDSSKFQAADFQMALPNYFETMRIPIVAGRAFTDADNVPERTGIIVDTQLAAKAFPNADPIGKRILIRARTQEPEWVEIIGVAAHQRLNSLSEPGREQIFITDGFVSHGAATNWAVRTAGDAAKQTAAVTAAIKSLDRSLLVSDIQTMDALVDKAKSGTRFSLLLIGVFAVVAVLLAGVGLYGVLSTVVRQRTAEIGIRMALGAEPQSIFSLVVGQGLRLSAAGIVIGLAAAFGLTRVMSSMLVGISPTDPATFAAMALLFLVVAAVASWLPGRRAAALDPLVALRDE